MRCLNNIMVTGGAGFIGSNFIRFLFEKASFDGRIVNVDALTYAGNPENLSDIEQTFGGKRYFFQRADICERSRIEELFRRFEIDTLVHFAAESHVDRSILGPEAFVRTNVMGTYTLLDVARCEWKGKGGVLFHHVSTDEVFGSLGSSGSFVETTPYAPRSPYSASKASSDHLAMAYHHTYGLPVTLSNGSNNYGPYQFPEKMIPLMILNMIEGKLLPIYGDGKNRRDWIYVEDHVSAIWLIMQNAAAGERFNVGGNNECENRELVDRLIEIYAQKTGNSAASMQKLITYVKDRPGHDMRYAINCEKLIRKLGWKQGVTIEQGLDRTIDWYLGHRSWIDRIRNGEYRQWIETNYGAR